MFVLSHDYFNVEFPFNVTFNTIRLHHAFKFEINEKVQYVTCWEYAKLNHYNK